MIATPDAPNAKDPNQMDPRSERETLGLDFGAKGGQDLAKQRVQPEEEMKRDFRITERLLIEHGFTVGCKGCEAKLKGSGVEPHSISCRRCLDKTMRAAGRDEEVLNRRDARMRLREREQRHSHRGGDRTPQSSPEDVPVEEEAEPTKRKAEETTRREQDVENQPSKMQRLETVTCEGDIESLMQAMERVLNQCSPKVRYGLPARATGDCTHLDVTSAINVLTKADPHAKDELYQDFEFINDVSGLLDHELAVKARKLEMDFRKMGVYDKVPRAAATRDGCRVITTKWVDINKGDQKAPNYRARLVGRELKLDSRLDLVAATPPLECANNQYGQQTHRIMTVYVKRACFCARSRRPVFFEIPIDMMRHDIVLFQPQQETASVGLGSLEEDHPLLDGVSALSSNFPMASSAVNGDHFH